MSTAGRAALLALGWDAAAVGFGEEGRSADGQARNQTEPAAAPAMMAALVVVIAVQAVPVRWVSQHVPASRSHTLSVWSHDAETTRWPSGVTAHARTLEVWPSSVASARPVWRFHTLSV